MRLAFSALAGVMSLALLDAVTSGTGPWFYGLITAGFAKTVQRLLDPTVPLIPDYSHSQANLQAIFSNIASEAASAESYAGGSASAPSSASSSAATLAGALSQSTPDPSVQGVLV